MNLLLIISMIAACVLLMFLDVYSTARNNLIQAIYETNPIFAEENGRANIGKLIFLKVALFAACFAAAMVLYFACAAGAFAFAVFPMMAVVHVPAVLKNFKLHKKFSR